MKIKSTIRNCLFAGVATLSVTCLSSVTGQTTTSTPPNPTGSEANSKSPSTSTAEVRDVSASPASPASAPDKTNSKDTTNALDKNPSTASTGSADKSATKDPTGTTADDQSARKDKEPREFSDKHFLVKAAEGGMTEVQLGKLAQEKGSSAQVKEFGSHMVMDHSKANDELKGLAQQKGVNVPTQLDAHHQAAVDRLSKLSGADFDRAYINDMVKDHEKTAADFERASSSAQDPDVKAFASKTLGVIKGHLADVEKIQSSMK